ncbi:low specificity L-threonine aldolase [Bacillus sp. AFS041924]|uniref:threonine aldolase family protein n=1 Tax=Bacillus sp. AFS041924 TaxID=2033503 RepID=UPI000BFCDCAA|nr:beta-eliminating lyase-related protein [Bacillus sp. AFS041924]PGS56540.1 low specificity L-threonine aldolase [Bacillus sp. AFS041924]
MYNKNINPFFESFKNTNQQLAGHGFRNVQILKDALNDFSGNEESDQYGAGNFIEDFQVKMAEFLGKESAVFFPSGTMAQQIALRIWCDQKGINKVAYHPLSHLEIHEEDGLKKLHNIQPILLADKSRVIELEDVLAMGEEISCLLLELPQREIGGQLPTYETLESISSYCREKGIKLHLDGARLMEILPYYKKTATEVCSLFDSVYMSFYKGIGGIAGAILAGDANFINESKIWKRRHGGDLISLYPYIISADYNFNQRANRMEQYYKNAVELAELFNSCYVIHTVPTVPVSNMFHVHYNAPIEKIKHIIQSIQEETKIGITGNLRPVNEEVCYCEISIGDQYSTISKEALHGLFKKLNDEMKSL